MASVVASVVVASVESTSVLRRWRRHTHVALVVLVADAVQAVALKLENRRMVRMVDGSNASVAAGQARSSRRSVVDGAALALPSSRYQSQTVEL